VTGEKLRVTGKKAQSDGGKAQGDGGKAQGDGGRAQGDGGKAQGETKEAQGDGGKRLRIMTTKGMCDPVFSFIDIFTKKYCNDMNIIYNKFY